MSTQQARGALFLAGQATRNRARQLSLKLILLGLGSLLGLILAAWTFRVQGWPLVFIELGIIGTLLLADRIAGPKVDRLIQGAEGERNIGRELDLLVPDGWHALHNVSLGRGDVDHVLIGPGGLFIIETKSHKGRIRVDQINRHMLQQAYAEKRLLERITGYKFEPLLVFSQAWLVGEVPAKRDGVTVLPARMLADFVSRRKPVVTTERAKQVYEQLAEALT